MIRTLRRASRAALCLGFATAGVLSVYEGPAAATPESPVGSGYYQIIAKHSGMCLDVAGYSYAHGAPIVQATCGGGHNQQWRLVPYSDGQKFRIQARHSGMCLDVAGGSRRHAAPVVQATCNGGSNQVWWFVQPAGRAPLVQGSLGLVPQVGHSVGIVVDHTGMVLDVAYASQSHGAQVVQAYPASGNGNLGLNQQWRFQFKS
ncbi:RICIN domain-containing protein [Streptomyces sp. NPDC048282]|uniref:RICIN domain-containing protein n=1 Tax=Streptomyces sp. NPDC048282 TaxID=3365528 RepID=UPI003716BB5A